MSLYLRLVIGPVVVCDIDLFSTVDKPDPDKEPPPQLAGGQGQVIYPEPVEDVETFGFQRVLCHIPGHHGHDYRNCR